jgi:hypothetical protein
LSLKFKASLIGLLVAGTLPRPQARPRQEQVGKIAGAAGQILSKLLVARHPQMFPS